MSDAATTTLAGALLAAQEEMPAVDRDGTNPHFESSFTTLSNLLSTVKPVLNKHGITVVQMPSHDAQGNPALTTRLSHSNGEHIEDTMPLLMTKSDPQSLGSALTYAKRYALAAFLAISDQEDDDGNAATSRQAASLPAASGEEKKQLAAALGYLLPKTEAEAVWGEIKKNFGGELYGPAAQAVVAVIAAKKALDE